MKDDTISRAAVLDEIHKYMEERDYTIGTLYDNICEMPSAQPTDAEIQRMQDIEQAMLGKAYECGKQDAQRWIPVSERLPEKSGEYFVTIKWTKYDYEVDCYEYNANCGEWNDGELFGGAVVAWIDRPAPWKGEEK